MDKLQVSIQTTLKLPTSKVVLNRFIRCTQRIKPFPSGYQLSVVCLGERMMNQLNQRYRNKDTATNVLSFAYDRLNGEVVLCLPVIRRQARDKGVSFLSELLYLLSHGLLHLHGLDHERSTIEAKTMERLEQRMLRECYR